MSTARNLDLTRVRAEMRNADKRSVHTDALDTLGKIIDKNQGRDAIHLAVEPLMAGENLQPGADVGIGKDGKAYNTLYKNGMSVDFWPQKHLGIVDPFLGDTVRKGQWFWMVIYPRKINSLRHVWSHPDIPDDRPIPIEAMSAADAKKRLAQIARELDPDDPLTVEDYIEGMEKGYWCDGGRWEGYGRRHHKPSKEAFDLYEKIFGCRPATEDERPEEDWYFTCSC